MQFQQTIMNIPSDLLARIQATGITEEDYKRVEQYINTIANIAPTVSPEYYILDYYRMKSYHTTPQQNSTGSPHRSHATDFADLYHDIPQKLSEKIWIYTIKWQEFVKDIPVDEQTNYVFTYNLQFNTKHKRKTICYKSRVLQAAPDGRPWLEFGIQSEMPYKTPSVMTAYNKKTTT